MQFGQSIKTFLSIISIFQKVPVSAILVLPVFSRIFQYLQYWYYQYFPESSSICNTGITSIFQNLQYWYYQYFPESSSIYNTHMLAMTSIF